MFDEFVAHAVANGETEFGYGTCDNAQRLLTRFNDEIDSIIREHGVETVGTAIWYLYGCESGVIHDVLDKSVAEGLGEFYRSMETLYDHGFARYCENTPQHFRCAGNLDTACYMLWDMDGIEYLTFHRSARRRQLVEPLVDFGLAHHHPAVQTSFLHCLGHQRDDFPEFVDFRIATFLQRQDLAPEIRRYAEECQTGMIL